jgi:hypothetical protein
MNEFQGKVIQALNSLDARNMELLDQVIDAAGDIADNTATDVTFGDGGSGSASFPDRIMSGPKETGLLGEDAPVLEAAVETSQTALPVGGDRMAARDRLVHHDRLRTLAAERNQDSGKSAHAERSESKSLPDPE